MPAATRGLMERLQFRGDAMAHVPFERISENRSGIVTVDASGTVWGHGGYDGKFNTELTRDTVSG